MIKERTEHTPAPWRVGGHPGDLSGENWREVLSDATEDIFGGPLYICQAVKFDAALIAAAPSLLAHLKALTDGIAAGAPIPPDGAAVTAAREVIRQAEGK